MFYSLNKPFTSYCSVSDLIFVTVTENRYKIRTTILSSVNGIVFPRLHFTFEVTVTPRRVKVINLYRVGHLGLI